MTAPAPPARNVRLVLEYDGTDLAGWQRQQNAPTVQGHLEAALARLLQQPVSTAGASRTDAGVHARGQVASFRTDRTIPLSNIRRGLNGMLPTGISVVEATDADDEFHPRFSATGKRYRYLVVARPDRSPRLARYAWHRSAPLDVDAMAVAAAGLLGEHDFAAFRSADCTAGTTMRRVDEISVRWAEPGVLAFEVRGNAFLRNMVRILVGTLIQVGVGRWTPGYVREILEARDRTRAGQTAPPHGLELLEVYYEGRRPLPRRPKPEPAPPDKPPAADGSSRG